MTTQLSAIVAEMRDIAKEWSGAAKQPDVPEVAPVLFQEASELLTEWADRLDALADTVGEVTEMSLCEIPRLILHENQLYRFTAASGCKACTDYLAPVADKGPKQAVAWRSKCPGDTRWLITAHEPTLPAGSTIEPLYPHPAPLSEAGGAVSREDLDTLRSTAAGMAFGRTHAALTRILDALTRSKP